MKRFFAQSPGSRAALIGLLVFPFLARAEPSPVPDFTFPAERYQVLWTKSPFAVASPTESAAAADYTLLGLAQIDGVAYVTLMRKSNAEHFVVSSAEPTHSLTLVSIHRGVKGEAPSASLLDHGKPFTLRQEIGATAVVPQPIASVPPGTAPSPEVKETSTPRPPKIRIRRPQIYVPPPPPK